MISGVALPATVAFPPTLLLLLLSFDCDIGSFKPIVSSWQ